MPTHNVRYMFVTNQNNVQCGTCVSVTVNEYWDITTHICDVLNYPICSHRQLWGYTTTCFKGVNHTFRYAICLLLSSQMHATYMKLPIDLLFEDTRPTASLNATLTVFPGNGPSEAPGLE